MARVSFIYQIAHRLSRLRAAFGKFPKRTWSEPRKWFLNSRHASAGERNPSIANLRLQMKGFTCVNQFMRNPFMDVGAHGVRPISTDTIIPS